jgi:hypothetical protein
MVEETQASTRGVDGVAEFCWQRRVVVPVEVVSGGCKNSLRPAKQDGDRRQEGSLGLAVDAEIQRNFPDRLIAIGNRSCGRLVCLRETQCLALLAQVVEKLAPVLQRERFADELGELPQLLVDAKRRSAGDIQ